MDENFMARPTDVLRSYMASHGFDENEIQMLLRMGRIAMGLEVITVVKLLEEHQLVAEHEQMIACLQTLLTDQDLLERSMTMYEDLCHWRRIKLVPDADGPSRVAAIEDVADASSPAGQPDASLPRGSNGALPGSDQTPDPPSAS